MITQAFFTFLTLLVASAALRAGPQAQVENTLPITTEPLCEVPPTVQFIALAREPGTDPKDPWTDMQVTLWEVRPGESALRRRVLGRSHWNAAPLLDSPTLLRWQVPANTSAAGPHYAVKLLKVDCVSFEITELLETAQAHALGRSGNKIYLQLLKGQSILDVDSGLFTELKPELQGIVKFGDDWLVEAEGKLARFDASNAKLMRRYEKIKSPRIPDFSARVDWNGGPIAVKHGRYLDEAGDPVVMLDFGESAILYRELCIWDLEAGTERKVRTRIQAVGGSGIALIPTDALVDLKSDQFRYTERFPARGEHSSFNDFTYERDTEWVTLDLATGKELKREPYRAVPGTMPSFDDDEPVPPYLRELFDQSPIRAWGPIQDLAHAFLVHSGIELNLPTEGVCKLDAVCRTPDGEELLVMNRGTFYHCNLTTQEIVQWPAPEALTKANVELHAVALR